jgi:hypothetical protein
MLRKTEAELVVSREQKGTMGGGRRKGGRSKFPVASLLPCMLFGSDTSALQPPSLKHPALLSPVVEESKSVLWGPLLLLCICHSRNLDSGFLDFTQRSSFCPLGE